MTSCQCFCACDALIVPEVNQWCNNCLNDNHCYAAPKDEVDRHVFSSSGYNPFDNSVDPVVAETLKELQREFIASERGLGRLEMDLFRDRDLPDNISKALEIVDKYLKEGIVP